MFSVCYILTQRVSTLEVFFLKMIVRYINVHLIIIIINNNNIRRGLGDGSPPVGSRGEGRSVPEAEAF